MPTVLILGASRGLGREFVRQYLADGAKVIATARKKSDVAALEKEGVVAFQLDVTRPDDFLALKKSLARRSLDVAIYNAGVTGPRLSGVSAIDKADFNAVMQTNVMGAMHAVPVLAPMLAKAQGKFAFVSSKMGSIGLMSTASSGLYRASKSALNAVMKAASLEWGPQGVTLFAFHPGWVKTDMGGAGADIDVATSIAGMRKVIAGASVKTNGKFINYDGTEFPW
ncbi:MAG: SDR family oxidoreductase [Betaproteobacteria bacterium]|nr:SDR family oxidoreductase [Betaproteobacteria bacterium]